MSSAARRQTIAWTISSAADGSLSRSVPRHSSGALATLSVRYSTIDSVSGSAKWRSSSTRSVALASTLVSRRRKASPRIRGDSSAACLAERPQSGTSDASAGRYSASSGASGIPVVRTSVIAASTMGRSGTGLAAWTARPTATVKPRADARAATSLASRDFPTPGSPARKSISPLWSALSSAAVMAPSSACRPTRSRHWIVPIHQSLIATLSNETVTSRYFSTSVGGRTCAWMIGPPRPRGFHAVALYPGQTQQPARDACRALHPADRRLKLRLRQPVLGVRPADAALIGKAPVEHVIGQILSPGQPLLVSGVLIRVECHLAHARRPAALADVVPEPGVPPLGQAAAPDGRAARIGPAGPAAPRLLAVQDHEQPERARRPVTPAVTDRRLRIGERDAVRYGQRPVRLPAKVDQPPRAQFSEFEQIGPAERPARRRERAADSRQAV